MRWGRHLSGRRSATRGPEDHAAAHFHTVPVYFWRAQPRLYATDCMPVESNPDFHSGKPFFSLELFDHGGFKWHFEDLPLHRSHT
jgi:hypothetical protein